MELLQDETYKQVYTSYEKLVKNSLVRNKDYDMKKFIGGLPVTLEQKDMSNLMTKLPNGKSQYTVTQKVDGTRMLMYTATVPGVKGGRMVYFIDRNTNIYRVRNSSQDSLDSVDSREMLIDGEVVFFDSDDNSHAILEINRVKGVSFMAFDILYGPNGIDVNTEGERVIGQDSSMIVPEDGKLRTQPWPYINRYDILYKLIMPGEFNKFDPLLVSSFRNKKWFNVEIKPIYFLDALKDYQNLYTQSGTGELQKFLDKHRKSFYDMINRNYGKTTSTFTNKKIKLDGLVFTASDTLYNIGAWNKLDTVQYKWKPNDEQTVDLMVVKTKNGNIVKFSDRFINNTWTKKVGDSYKNVTVDLPDYVNSNTIVEFQVLSRNNFKFKNVRKDKNYPNTLRTVLNVIRSVENPVDINDLYYFANIGEGSTKEELTKLLSYSSRANLLRCISTSNKAQILENEDVLNIQKQFNKIGIKDVEVEFRLGSIRKTGSFDPNISEEMYKKSMKIIDGYKMKKTVEYYVDAYSDELAGVRTRHIYSNDFKKFILLESIIKKRLNDINIDMSKVWDNDIRISTSTETKITDYVTSGKYNLKQRTSYTDLTKTFRVDFTVISDGKLINRDFIENESPNRKRQIEIEILKNNVNVNELFVFITNLIKT